jgi:hypothetical protein
LNLGGNFSGVSQKFRPPVGGHDPLGGAAKNRETHCFLHVLDGFAQGGLAHEQIVGGLGDGAGFLHLQRIAKILRVDGSHFLSLCIPIEYPIGVAKSRKNVAL